MNQNKNMNQNTKTSPWLSLVKMIKKAYKNMADAFSQFSLKYPKLMQNIQLTFLYFFAVIDLVHGVLSSALSFDYYPEILDPVFFLIQAIMQNPLFQLFSSPEKVFFLSYVVMELIVVRSIFNFSLFVRYNVLLIFGLLTVQGLIISYCDLLFHREIAEPVAQWTFDEGEFLFTDDATVVYFFLATFFFFLSLYIYFYVNALRGKYASFPGIRWLTDSTAFWFRIKTSTIPYGKKKRKGKKK